MARSVNMVVIVGNLTRDPEMRYTPAGHAVTGFGVATNRSWKTAEGSVREEAEFHNVVAWNKLAEICSQYLKKGRQVYVQGRLQTRTWEGKDGSKRTRTEIVADDMLMLGSSGGGGAGGPSAAAAPAAPATPAGSETSGKEDQSGARRKSAEKKENVNPKEMPF